MSAQYRLLAAVLVAAFVSQAHAGGVFTHTIDLVANPPAGAIVDVDGELIAGFAYEHLNPTETVAGGPWTPSEYDQALLDGLVAGATLEITIDDLDLGEVGGVVLEAADGSIHPLGLLNTMGFADTGGVEFGSGNADPSRLVSTIFPIDPAWLDGLPVGILFSVDSLIDEFELESSVLAVTVIPEPATLVLVVAGVGFGGLIRRRKHATL